MAALRWRAPRFGDPLSRYHLFIRTRREREDDCDQASGGVYTRRLPPPSKTAGINPAVRYQSARCGLTLPSTQTPRGTRMFARLSFPLLAALSAGFLALPATADGPQDNIPDNVRPVPPKGNELPPAVRDEIRA